MSDSNHCKNIDHWAGCPGVWNDCSNMYSPSELHSCPPKATCKVCLEKGYCVNCKYHCNPGSLICIKANSDPVTLQGQVARWHTQRFPEAESHHVMIKAMEELGEVASALNGDLAKNDGRYRGGSVPKEVGDVLVCLMALLGRWYPDFDALDEAKKKLAILTDPNSGHRSAALHDS